MAWRNLTAKEEATLPEVRLGGALLWLTIAALALCIVALAGTCFAFDRLREIGGRYMIAVAFIVAWSLTFIVMTLLRARATPVVASIGLAAWVAYRFCVSILAEAGWPLASTCCARPSWWRPSAAIWPAGCGPMPIIAVAFLWPERL
jgi:hypothetical protein